MRLTPRENPDINKWWMCDDGRLNYKYVEADDRIGVPMVRKDGALVETSWDEALAAAADGLRAAGAVIVGAVVSVTVTVAVARACTLPSPTTVSNTQSSGVNRITLSEFLMCISIFFYYKT